MTKFKLLFAALVATAGFCGQSQASIVFTTPTDTATISFSDTFQTSTLLATVMLTLTGLTDTTATFATTVTNNSSGGGGNNRLGGFAIDVVSPTLTGASATGNGWGAAINQNYPSGFQNVDLCAFLGSNCSGGGNAGLPGGSGPSSFTLTLMTAGNFNSSGITFTEPFGARFQSIGIGGNGSTVVTGQCTVGCSGGPGGNPVPEPGTIALFGLGLFALAAARRRSN